MQDKNNEWKMTGHKRGRGRGRGGFVPQFRNPQLNQFQIDHRNINHNNTLRFNQDMNPHFRSPSPWINHPSQFHWQQNIPRLQRLPLLNYPPTRHRFSAPRYAQPNNQNNRPTSPLPGSEEARQRTIDEASARIKEQLNLIESSNKESTTTDNENINNLSSNFNNPETIPQTNVLGVNNSVLVQNEMPITKSAEVSSIKKRVKKLPKENATNIQELRTKIINQFTSMSKGKIQNLVHNPGSTKYDVALQHLVRDMRLNLSSELRNMYNKSDTPQNESIISHFNTLVPDLGVEIANLPDILVDELSNILQLDMNVLNYNESEPNLNSDNLNQNSDETNQVSENLIEPELFFRQAEQMLNSSDFNMLNFRDEEFPRSNCDVNNLEMPFTDINTPQNEITCVKSEFGVPQTTPVYQESLFSSSANFGIPKPTLPGNNNSNCMSNSNFSGVQNPYFNFSHLTNPLPPNFNSFSPVNISSNLTFSNGTACQSTLETGHLGLERQEGIDIPFPKVKNVLPGDEIYDPTQNLSDESNKGFSIKTKKIQLVFKDVNKMAPKPFDINVLNDLELTVQDDFNNKNERNIINKKAITTNLNANSAKTKNVTTSISDITSQKIDSSKNQLENIALPSTKSATCSLLTQESNTEKLLTPGSSKEHISTVSSKDSLPTFGNSRDLLSSKKETLQGPRSNISTQNQVVKIPPQDVTRYKEDIPLPGSSKEHNQPLQDAQLLLDTTISTSNSCKTKVSEKSEVMSHHGQNLMLASKPGISPNTNEHDSKSEKRPSLERHVRHEDKRTVEKRTSKERSRKDLEKNSRDKYFDNEVVIVDEYKSESKRHYKHSEERFEHSKHHGQRYEDNYTYSLEDYREHQRSRHISKRESSKHKSPIRSKHSGPRSIVDNELPKHKTSLEERLKVLKQIESIRECNSKIINEKKDKEPSSKASIVNKEKEVTITGRNKSPPPKIKSEASRDKIQNDKNKNLSKTDDIIKDVRKTEKSKLYEKKMIDKNRNNSIIGGKTQTDTLENKEQSTKDFFRQELLNFDHNNENNKKENTIKEKNNSHKTENLQLTSKEESTAHLNTQVQKQSEEKYVTSNEINLDRKKEILQSSSEQVDIAHLKTQNQNGSENRTEQSTLSQTTVCRKDHIVRDTLLENLKQSQNQELYNKEVSKDCTLSKYTLNVSTHNEKLDVNKQINVEESQKNPQKIKLKRTQTTQSKNKEVPPKDTKSNETEPREPEVQQSNSNLTENKQSNSTSDKPSNYPKMNEDKNIADKSSGDPKQPNDDVTKNVTKENHLKSKLNENESNCENKPDTKSQTCYEEQQSKINMEITQEHSDGIESNTINETLDQKRSDREEIISKPKSDSEILKAHITANVQLSKRPVVKIIRLTPGQIEEAIRPKDVITIALVENDDKLTLVNTCQPDLSSDKSFSKENQIDKPNENSLESNQIEADELPSNRVKSAFDLNSQSQTEAITNKFCKDTTIEDQNKVMEQLNKSELENKVEDIQDQIKIGDIAQTEPEKTFNKDSVSCETIVPNTNSDKVEKIKDIIINEITSKTNFESEVIKKSREDSERVSKMISKEKSIIPNQILEPKKATNTDCSQKTSDNLFKMLDNLKPKDKKPHDESKSKEKTPQPNNTKKENKHVEKKHSSYHKTSLKDNDHSSEKDHHKKDKSHKEEKNQQQSKFNENKNKMMSKDGKTNEMTKLKSGQNLNKNRQNRDSSVESVAESKVSNKIRKISESSLDSHLEKKFDKSSKTTSKSTESVPEKISDKDNKTSFKNKKDRDSSIESLCESKARKTRKNSESSIDSQPEKKFNKSSKPSSRSIKIRDSSAEIVTDKNLDKANKTTKTKNSRDSSMESVPAITVSNKTRKISDSSIDLLEKKSDNTSKPSSRSRKIRDSSAESVTDKNLDKANKTTKAKNSRDSSMESVPEIRIINKTRKISDSPIDLPEKKSDKSSKPSSRSRKIRDSSAESVADKNLDKAYKTIKAKNSRDSSVESIPESIVSNKTRKISDSLIDPPEKRSDKPSKESSKVKKIRDSSPESIPEKTSNQPNKRSSKTKKSSLESLSAKHSAKSKTTSKSRKIRDSSVETLPDKHPEKPLSTNKNNKTSDGSVDVNKNKKLIVNTEETTSTKPKKTQQTNKIKPKISEFSSLENLFDVDKSVTVINSNKMSKITNSIESISGKYSKAPDNTDSKSKKIRDSSVESVSEKNYDKSNKIGSKTKKGRKNSAKTKPKQSRNNNNINSRESSVESEKISLTTKTKAKKNRKIRDTSDESQLELKTDNSKSLDLKRKHNETRHISKLESDISETEFLGFKPETPQKTIKSIPKRKLDTPEPETREIRSQDIEKEDTSNFRKQKNVDKPQDKDYKNSLHVNTSPNPSTCSTLSNQEKSPQTREPTTKPKTRESIMKRMMNIDLEIQKLMQEKWDLYKELQLSNKNPGSSSAENLSSELIPMNMLGFPMTTPQITTQDSSNYTINQNADIPLLMKVTDKSKIQNRKESTDNDITSTNVFTLLDNLETSLSPAISKPEDILPGKIESKSQPDELNRNFVESEPILETIRKYCPILLDNSSADNSEHSNLGPNKLDQFNQNSENKDLVNKRNKTKTKKRRKRSSSTEQTSFKKKVRLETGSSFANSESINSLDNTKKRKNLSMRKKTLRKDLMKRNLAESNTDSDQSEKLVTPIKIITSNKVSKVIKNYKSHRRVSESNSDSDEKPLRPRKRSLESEPPRTDNLISNKLRKQLSERACISESEVEKDFKPCFVQLERIPVERMSSSESLKPVEFKDEVVENEIGEIKVEIDWDDNYSANQSSKLENITPNDVPGESEQTENLDESIAEDVFCTGHTRSILDIKVIGSEFLAASEDGNIYKFNIKTGSLTGAYSGHTMAVTSLIVPKISINDTCSSNIFFSASLDASLKCYNIDTYELIGDSKTDQAIQCMDSAWGHIFLGTYNGHLHIYDIKKKQLDENSITVASGTVLMLKATTEGCRQVLVLASRQREIIVRDAFTGLLLRTMCEDQKPTVYSLLIDRSYVYCGTSDKGISVLDFNSGSQILSYNSGKGVVCMLIYRSLLFAGCYDGMIYVFNTKTHSHVSTIPGPGCAMLLSLAIVNDYIIAGTKKDQLLKIWKIPQDILSVMS